MKFLGTIKNSNTSPFEFFKVNENGKQVYNGKSVMQTFGTRTIIFARSRTDQNIRVSVLRHGMGKVRAVRIATNIPECIVNAWVDKTVSVNLIRLPHPEMEPELPPDRNKDDEPSTEEQRTKHGWSSFLSSIYQLT